MRRSDTNIQWTPKLAKAEEFGIDITALLDNLMRSPKERVRRHQVALETFKKFHNAANKQ